MRLGVLATHPIQYHAPLFRELAERLDLHVYFAHRQSGAGQAAAGFGVEFEWDVDLLDGYNHTFLTNRSTAPDTNTFGGCDTPDIRDIIRREAFDAFLVTGWNTRSFWQAITACWRSNTPLLIRGDSQLATTRSRAKQLVKSVLYRAFIPRFDGYLVVGERARAYYLHYGADPGRMHFAPHFVDNEFFRAGAEAAQHGKPLRDELGYNADTIVLLFVGKFIPKKRPLDVVAAAGRLRRQGLDVRLLFVGSGELEAVLRREVDAEDVPTDFAGFKNQTELPAYYAAADLLVLPSDAGETWGLVVNEAMACGTPAVVSSAVGCSPDLIDAGKTGKTFPLGDVHALAKAVASLLPHLGTAAITSSVAAKMDTYSVQQAAEGTLRAVEAVTRSQPFPRALQV